ncbi:MAG: hypothetical protein KDA58_15005 [Planctomycetaceae bacterium]|nr:hypothetical protein [Planctomycetaceae bacterium]
MTPGIHFEQADGLSPQPFGAQRGPQAALFAPVGGGGDGTDVGFFDRVAAFCGSGEEQDGFLDVRCESEERQDLSRAI